MATKNIHLRNKEIGGVDTIVATPLSGNVSMKLSYDKIKIHNHLEEEATVTFYDFPIKTLGAEIGGFCGESPPLTEYKIAPKKKLDCEPKDPGPYTYIAQAKDHVTLDPVIIIDPVFWFSRKVTATPDMGKGEVVVPPPVAKYSAQASDCCDAMDWGAAASIVLVGLIIGVILGRILK